MNLKLALAAFALVAGFAQPASAHPPHAHHGGHGWDFLGTRVVSHRAERDRVNANGYRRYSEVRLCVSNRAVRLHDIDVVFGNGGHQDLSVRSFLRPGECTRPIDLRGYSRDIRFVDLFYQTAGRNFGPRAEVTVFAR